MTEQCNKCRFWREEMQHRDPLDVDYGFGWCRRNPPAIIDSVAKHMMPQLAYGQQVDPDMDALDLLSASKFPSTHSADWCGSYEPISSVPLC